MENNKNMRELYNIYLELGHEVFEEKIKKPMEIYLHNTHDSSNVFSKITLGVYFCAVINFLRKFPKIHRNYFSPEDFRSQKGTWRGPPGH